MEQLGDQERVSERLACLHDPYDRGCECSRPIREREWAEVLSQCVVCVISRCCAAVSCLMWCVVFVRGGGRVWFE